MISKSDDFEMCLNIWCTLLCTCICLFLARRVFSFFWPRQGMSEAEAACCMDKKRSSERVVAFRPPGKDVPVLETKGKRDLKKEKKKQRKKNE